MPVPFLLTGQAPLPAAELPRELLQQAWQDLRARRHFSLAGAASLDETLAADGTGASLVRLHARLLANGVPRYRALPDPTQQTVRPPALLTPQPPAGVDFKRRASGERDDD